MASPLPTTIDLSKYIEIQLMGKRPHIRKRRLPVSLLAKVANANGWSVARTAAEFTLDEAQVLAAMLYYEENKTLLDEQDEKDEALWEELRQQSR